MMSSTDKKYVLFWLTVIAMIAILTGAFAVWVARIPDERQAYVDACRAAGGVPIYEKSSINCARPEGGWIDVR